MSLSPRKNGLTSLFKEVRVFKVSLQSLTPVSQGFRQWESVLPVSIREKIAIRERFLTERKSRILPQGPCHTKNTTVIVIHYIWW